MSRMMQTSVSSVVERHAVDKVPTVKVLGYTLAGEGLAHIVAEVAHTRDSRENHALVGESLSRVFENKLTAVACSFLSIDKAPYTERIAGVVRVNTQVAPANAPGFRSVSSNIFMDDEEKMWVLRKTEAGDILVKSTGIEDHHSLKGLLDVVCSGGYSLSSEFRAAQTSLSKMRQSIAGGDFVHYVSQHSADTKFGYVVASDVEGKLIILPQDGSSEEGEVVDPAAVVNKVDVADAPEPEMSEQEKMDQAVSVSRGVVDMSTLLSFYKKVYARSGPYYNELAKRIRAHAFC